MDTTHPLPSSLPEPVAAPAAARQPLAVILAWTIVLLVSDLPNVLLAQFSIPAPPWLWWAKTGGLGLGLILAVLWKPARALWKFTLVFTVFYLAISLRDGIWNGVAWPAAWMTSFVGSYLVVHLLDIGAALLVIAALWLVFRDRKQFFLARGDPSAPIKPVTWLGIKSGESWRTFGWIFTACATAAVAVPVFMGVLPQLSDRPAAFARALPLLPVAILLAGLNAFAEEVYYRASMLSTLRSALGDNQALLLSVVFFGLAHYLAGSPPGIIGAAFTGFLAFLLGKSILETKGLLWAWVMHLAPDVVIFFSYALLWK